MCIDSLPPHDNPMRHCGGQTLKVTPGSPSSVFIPLCNHPTHTFEWVVGGTWDLLLLTRIQQRGHDNMCVIIVPGLLEPLSPWLVLRRQVAFGHQPTRKWVPWSYDHKVVHFANTFGELGSGSSPSQVSDETWALPDPLTSVLRRSWLSCAWIPDPGKLQTVSMCCFKPLCV